MDKENLPRGWQHIFIQQNKEEHLTNKYYEQTLQNKQTYNATSNDKKCNNHKENITARDIPE